MKQSQEIERVIDIRNSVCLVRFTDGRQGWKLTDELSPKLKKVFYEELKQESTHDIH